MEKILKIYQLKLKKKYQNGLKNSSKFLENNSFSHKKSVIGINIKTFEIFKFDSQKEAGKYFNISPSAIGNSCIGRINTAKNIYWRFNDENFKGFDLDFIKNINKVPEERKNKLSKIFKGRKGQITRSRKIIGVCIDSDQIYTKKFDTSISAARMLNIHCVKVNKEITKDNVLMTKGWFFTFIENEKFLTDEFKIFLKERYIFIKKNKNLRGFNIK